MSSQELTTNREDWNLVIRPQRPWWDFGIREIWKYRDLIRLWVRREFVASYKQTVLGPLWHVIPTIVTSGVFTLIFSGVARISTEGVPPYLFYMAGNTLWSLFSSCLLSTSNTFAIHMGIFGKVYFPRMCMPIASIISQLIGFGVRLSVFTLVWIYFLLTNDVVRPTILLALLPVLVLIVAGMGLAFGSIISALTTKYRDLQQLLTISLSLVMYATPIVYPLSQVPENWRWVLLLNPLTPVIETFRLGFLGTSPISPIYLVYSVIFTMIALFISLIMFNRAESNFLDTV